MNFSTFLLKKFLWDFYDNFFTFIVLNFLYLFLLYPFYKSLLIPKYVFIDILLSFFILLLLAPIFNYALSIAYEKDPNYSFFLKSLKKIDWKKYILFSLFATFILILIISNFIFYKSFLKNPAFIVTFYIVFFVILLTYLLWLKLIIFSILSNTFTKRFLYISVGIIIEYFHILFLYELFWISMFIFSIFFGIGFILFFPCTYILFFAIFFRLIHYNYKIKEQLLEEKLSKEEFFNKYKRKLREFYIHYAGKDNRYKRTLKDLIKPWR